MPDPGTGTSGAQPVIAFGIGDLNPLTWLGRGAAAVAVDGWKAAMIGLWSAGLWLMQLAFKVIDAFTTPDLGSDGPMASVLPTTLWLGAGVAALMMLLQLGTALIRRDGQSLGRVVIGIAQFGLAWAGCLGIGAGLVAAAAGLEKGILQAMLDVDSMSGVDLGASWPRDVDDATLATVLGVLALLLVIPAAFFYILIMFVREAALIVLIATAPISAAGLMSDATKAWFWKSLRWFVACLLIAPAAALMLGIGVQLSRGIVVGQGDPTAAAAGMAVVGALIIAIGACCPLALFRLLAFVEPGTASGGALRQSWSDAGGLSGVVSGGKAAGGGGAATAVSGDGRSGGEAAAESQTGSRLSAMLGPAGAAVGSAAAMAHRAADLGGDVLGQAGIGSPGATAGGPSYSGTSGTSSGPAPTPRQAGAADGDGEADAPATRPGSGAPPQPPAAPSPAAAQFGGPRAVPPAVPPAAGGGLEAASAAAV